MKKISVSVGIPAYNESANIVYLIEDLLEQKMSNGRILEIIVASDGSTDTTVSLLKALKNKRVKIIDGKKKLGKNKRLNRIFRKFRGDILVLLDADIKIHDEKVIDEIINEFIANNSDLIAGNAQPIKGKTYVEKGINNFVASLNFIKGRMNKGNNVYSVRGPIIALSKKYAKNIVLPIDVPDDRYLYLLSREMRLKFSYSSRARVWYRSPQTIKDQMNQGMRFRKDKENLYKYFSKEFINAEYFIPIYLRLFIPVIQILKSPIAYIVMKFMHIKIILSQKNTEFTWSQVESTKVRISE